MAKEGGARSRTHHAKHKHDHTRLSLQLVHQDELVKESGHRSMAGWSRSRKSCVPYRSSRRCPVRDIKPRRQDRPTRRQGLCEHRAHAKSPVAAGDRWQSRQYAWRFLSAAFHQAAVRAFPGDTWQTNPKRRLEMRGSESTSKLADRKFP